MHTFLRRYLTWILVICTSTAFGLGLYADYLLPGVKSMLGRQDAGGIFAVREYDERYEFIRPLLICQINEQTETSEFTPLKGRIRTLIDQAAKEGTISEGSVYFRDLNTGRWMGVNELQPHYPASLLKVPIMMAYLKETESAPEILTRRYTYIKQADDTNPLVTKPLLTDGKTYTVDELIRGMVTQSDNSAKDVLMRYVDQQTLAETYSVLGIEVPYESADPYEISTKQYALFFRVLYNGTFLTREMSNSALARLSEVEFDKGLRAGTPANIKIAHKHGIRDIAQGKNSHAIELSDCGIVYSQPSPYLLCVMVSGSNPYALADVIKHIAEMTYQSVITL